MSIRPFSKQQVINDENDANTVNNHTKAKNNLLNENSSTQNGTNNSTSTTSSSHNNNQTILRTVLGVLPVNSLGSHNNQEQIQPLSQEQNIQQPATRTRIPILVDNAHHNASSSQDTIEDQIMETSQSNDQHNIENQENYDRTLLTQSQQQQQQQPTLHHHHSDIIETEELDDEELEDIQYNESLSPILTESIRNEIERVYARFGRDTLDPNDEDTYDVTMVAEYGNRIFNYLHSLETKYKPNPRYMEEMQEDLQWDHRSTLLDWLVQLHSRFNLLPETLFLSVNIIDRFLSKRTISVSRFQLCGAAALFIAAKYEEINVPTVSQMIYMLGNQYSRDSFLRAEKFMVETLGFEFGWPGPMSFLRRGSKADDYDNEVRTLAKYFLEITIMDPKFVSSPPSWLAAGAQFLSRKMLARGEWSEAHIYYTGYTSQQLLPIAEYLEECCVSAEIHHRTIFQKYSERRFKRSSLYVQQYLQQYYEDIQ